ncbi:MAG: hypothetical protein OIF32_06205 [Campylobacterales bacterium]|nr:hypothetical protein [Campylobacterales bacterium]
MYIDGDVLVISTDMDTSDVEELKSFVESRLDYIEEIVFEEENLEKFTSSSLFQLLFGIKKSKPEIKIDMIDKGSIGFSELGIVKWV